MPATYSVAQEAQIIGAELIEKYHQHLALVRIEYIFNDQVLKEKGKEMLGRAKKKSGLDAYLAGNDTAEEPQPFFVIEISKPAWDLLNQKQKRALVDHELCHCLWDVEKGIYMRTHDVEEFSEIIKRHGLWQPDVELFATIAAKHVKQMDLPMTEPDVTKSAAGNSTAAESDVKVVKANGKGSVPTIRVDLEKKCSKCGDKGATESGLCLKCAADKAVSTLEPLKETVAKKRGRSAAARAN